MTTPFSLVRLLSCHCFLFLRLCHLVLDEADQLVSLAPDEVTTNELMMYKCKCAHIASVFSSVFVDRHKIKDQFKW